MAQQTIPANDTTTSSHVGTTPSTGPFAVDFPFFSLNDVVVTKLADGLDPDATITLVRGADYSLTGVSTDDGSFSSGTITLTLAVSNTTITRYRTTPVERLSNFPLQGFFSRLALNAELNKITAILQENQREDGENDSELAAIEVALAGITNLHVGDTPPGNPVDNMFWWNSVRGELFIWYDDGNSSQWVPATPLPTMPTMQGDVWAIDYGLSTTGDPAANVTAINQAIIAGAARGVRTVISGGTYTISGEIKTVSNLHLYFEPNSILKPVGWSLTGAIITNLTPNSTAAASIQTNITIDGLTMDFSAYPASPIGTAQGGTTNTITLAASDPATSAMIVGRFLRLMQGTGAGPTVYAVSAYNAGTKVATITATWAAGTPDNTTVYQWGWNDNAIGLGAGVSDVRMFNTRVYNLPGDMFTAGGSKAIDYEQGLENCHIDGVWCHGRPESNCVAAVFVQGRSGTYVNGAKRNASRIMVKNVYAENCGAAVSVGGVDTSEDPTGNPDQSMVIIDGVTFKNCGHMPYRFVTTDQQKSGAITIFRAQNVIISNVNGYNESTYPATTPGYPTDYAARVGFGLTGPIGAVIWGWGRNVTIDNVSYYGNADSVIRINRCRAYGDDGGIPGPGQPTNVFDFRATNILAVGTFTNAVAVDSTASARVSNANLKMNAQINLGQSSVCPALMSNMSGYTNSQVDIFDRTTATRVRGQIDRIVTDGNTLASFRQGLTTDYTMNAVSIGGGALNNTLVRVTGDVVASPAGTAWGMNFAPVVQPSVTGTANYINSTMTLADNAGASNFQINAFRASMTALGASTTLTFAMGFYADSTMTLATNNYGYYGNIAAGTGRWNLYMLGTAQNWFAGNVGVGAGLSVPTAALDITPATTTQSGLRVRPGAAPTTPNDGDMWTTSAGMFVRINGVTKTVTLT